MPDTMAVARALVRGVKFRSQISPEVTYDPWGPTPPPTQRGIGVQIMRVIRPEVTVETPAGPVTVAPYGPPTRNYLPLVVAGVVVGVVGVVTVIGWIARRLR